MSLSGQLVQCLDLFRSVVISLGRTRGRESRYHLTYAEQAQTPSSLVRSLNADEETPAHSGAQQA